MATSIYGSLHERRVNKIIALFLSLSEARGEKTPCFRRASLLKRRIYTMIRDMKANGSLTPFLQAAFSSRNAPRLSKKLKDNEYYAFLRVILRGKVSRRPGEIIRIARELKYAQKHDVPEEFLIGFLYQCGSHARIVEMLAAGKMEPWWEYLKAPGKALK